MGFVELSDVEKLIKKRVEALKVRLKESGCGLSYLDRPDHWRLGDIIKELESLDLDLKSLDKGGMVLSPREVEVVECFARGWDAGDDRSLYGSLCYQDAFDLMGRLKVDCSGVRDLVQEYQDRVDDSDDSVLVQHFEDLHPGAVLKERVVEGEFLGRSGGGE